MVATPVHSLGIGRYQTGGEAWGKGLNFRGQPVPGSAGCCLKLTTLYEFTIVSTTIPSARRHNANYTRRFLPLLLRRSDDFAFQSPHNGTRVGLRPFEPLEGGGAVVLDN